VTGDGTADCIVHSGLACCNVGDEVAIQVGRHLHGGYETFNDSMFGTAQEAAQGLAGQRTMTSN
jgi:hypothetical protein